MATDFATILMRRGSADYWAGSGRPLSSGEWGYDETNRVVKIGDGFTMWNDLPAATLSSADGQLPTVVRSALASNIVDISTTEGAAVAQAAGREGNFTVASMGRARAAFAGVRAGTRSAKILCVGDSTTAGYGTSSALSYPSRLVAALAAGVPARAGLSIPPRQVEDPRWSLGGWAVINSFGWADSLALMSDNPGVGLASYTPGALADTFDVYYFGTGGYGTLHVELDTGEKIDVDTSGAAGSVQKVTVTASVATANHVVNFYNPTPKPVAVLGVDAYVAATPNARVGNVGVSGSASGQWGSVQGAVTGSGSAAAIRAYAPDLTLIMLGINDAKMAVSVDAYLANVAATIAAAKASGSVMLLSVVPSNTPAEDALERQYRDALPGFARTQGVGFVDILGRFGSYAESQPLGMYSDGLHPSTIGYVDIATAVARAIEVA
ncbi:GDSL-like lipase/acylhydrolase family protein [Curtobacterium sp. PhB172]|uniref:SGNH/GDSL hydrolase family protein n=1 Tax=Curtobacterium sp. PhB172 TaxID=2485196 RepID=UPI000F4D2526|nr:SGNH/GDSL hydrolase family protein [Curtobacterium sp. PhB172]ROS63921.1 GDSL-like lipase/acylhydrolase family protein [Curtobacterium sp. PhB172]